MCCCPLLLSIVLLYVHECIAWPRCFLWIIEVGQCDLYIGTGGVFRSPIAIACTATCIVTVTLSSLFIIPLELTFPMKFIQSRGVVMFRSPVLYVPYIVSRTRPLPSVAVDVLCAGNAIHPVLVLQREWSGSQDYPTCTCMHQLAVAS